MWGKCGENVGKILYKNALQVSVGHLRVPGAGIEPARIAPLVFETSASTDSAIRAFALLAQPFGCFSVPEHTLCIDETKRLP